MTWEPKPAGDTIEGKMEQAELSKEDRDEVRHFVEVLHRREDKRDGKELPPIPEGMRDWLLGADSE